MKKMKKVLFLMSLLFLLVLGTAGVKAQVRIGGNAAPNVATVLDLNATDTTNTGTKTLALPRVSLASTTDLLSNTTLLTGMLVYNAGGSLSTGVYYWNGTNWNRVDGATLGGDTIVGNEVIGATTNGGLTRDGLGTAASPFTLRITPFSDIAGTQINAGVATTAVTWSRVYYGDVTCTFYPGRPCVVTAGGIPLNSICDCQDQGVVAHSGSNSVRIIDLLQRTGAVAMHCACWAASVY